MLRSSMQTEFGLTILTVLTVLTVLMRSWRDDRTLVAIGP